MKMKFKEPATRDFAPAPVGNHIARCIKVIDLGTQKNEYKGEVKFPHQVAISWELPNELMSEGDYAGKPFIVTAIYTASLSEKANLRHDLESWRGRAFTQDELMGFDSANILNKPCMISVIHSEKGKARVHGVASVPKGMEIPAQINKSVHFSLEPESFSQEVYESLSEWYQKTIALSPEFQELESPSKPTKTLSDMDDDIPF
jgi:hypothetical protein